MYSDTQCDRNFFSCWIPAQWVINFKVWLLSQLTFLPILKLYLFWYSTLDLSLFLNTRISIFYLHLQFDFVWNGFQLYCSFWTVQSQSCRQEYCLGLKKTFVVFTPWGERRGGGGGGGYTLRNIGWWCAARFPKLFITKICDIYNLTKNSKLTLFMTRLLNQNPIFQTNAKLPKT